METISLMEQVVAANPTDVTAKLVLADAIQDTGDEARAAEVRREVAATELRAKLVKAKVWLGANSVFTLGTAKATKGYAARSAEAYLTNHPSVLVYVYHDVAITKTGFRKDRAGNIMYHRKSSGGRWGRSVQMHRVSL